MPLIRKRKKFAVTQMEPDAVSWVKQGAVPGENTLLIQGIGSDAGTDVHELLQTYGDRLSDTDDPHDQFAITCALAAELTSVILEPVTQTVPDLTVQVAEARAWNGGCDAWWAFQSALWQVESPEECMALIDQLAAFLKSELTAAGDGDGDEPKYMKPAGSDNSALEQGAGDKGATMTAQTTTAPAGDSASSAGTAPVTQADTPTQETPEEGTAAAAAVTQTDASVAQADGIDTSQSSDTQTDDNGDGTQSDMPATDAMGTGDGDFSTGGTVTQTSSATDALSFLNGIKQGPVKQEAGVVTQSGESITLTRADLAEIVKAAVKQAQSEEVQTAVKQALGRPRPVGSQQGEEVTGTRPAVTQGRDMWSNSPFDAIGR